MNLEKAYTRLREACEVYDGKNDMIIEEMGHYYYDSSFFVFDRCYLIKSGRMIRHFI